MGNPQAIKSLNDYQERAHTSSLYSLFRIRNLKENDIINIIGNREIIRNYCNDDDFYKVGKPIPAKSTRSGYVLTRCMNCGTVLPSNIKTLRRNPPKKCCFCSGIGYRSSIPTNRNAYIEKENCYEIIISYKDTTVSAFIDKQDKPIVDQYIWRVTQKRNKYYAVTGQAKNHTQLYMHNLLAGRTKHEEGIEIDHIDGNSLNNRRENLRRVSRIENIHNTSVRIDNKIGIRGISKSNRGYMVDFVYNKSRYYFRPWETLEEAVCCRKAAEDIFGLNIISSNPIAKQYMTLSEQEENIIRKYVSEKILGN